MKKQYYSEDELVEKVQPAKATYTPAEDIVFARLKGSYYDALRTAKATLAEGEYIVATGLKLTKQ